jgi:hypothetical protein
LSIKPPQILAPRAPPLPLNTLEVEMMQERAAALGRVTRAFEQALAAFKDFDATPDGRDDRQRHIRREYLLDAAAEALFAFVVQRESCGLRNTEAVLRELRVPSAVRLRMGAARRR